MQIDPTETIIKLDVIPTFPTYSLDNLVYYKEIESMDGKIVTTKGKLHLNISAWNKQGVRIAGLHYNPKQYTEYNLESPTAKR